MVRRILFIGLSFTLLMAVLIQGAFFANQFIAIFGLCVILAIGALVEHCRVLLPLAAAPLLVNTSLAASLNNDFNSALPTLGGIALFTLVLVIASSLETRHLNRILTDAALLAAATAWYGVTFRSAPYGRIAQDLWRGSSSITYSNVAAVVIAVGLIVVADKQRLNSSLINELTIVALLAGFASTQSRAGALALAIGLILFAITTRLVAWGNLVAPAMAGATAGAAVVATSPVANPARPLLSIAGLVLAVALVTGLHFQPRMRWAALAIILLAGGIVLAGPGAEARRQISGVRLTLGSEDRANEWEAAAELFTDNLLLGVGPGNAPLIWEADGQFFEAEFAHNEYLQLAAEQGLLGLAALLATMLTVIVLALKRAQPYVIAAITVLMVHAGFDFLAHVPVTLMVLSILIAIPVTTDLEPNGP